MGFPILESFDYYASTSATIGLLSKWSNQSGGGGPAIIAGRFGGQALRMTDGTGATSNIRRVYSTPHSDFSIGFAFRFNSGPTAFGNGPILRLESAAVSQMSVYLDGNGGSGTIVRVYRGLGTTQLIASPAGQFTQSAWGFLQVFGKIDQTVGWVELWINGIFIARFDGDTAALAGTTMDGIILACVDHSGSGNAMDFDDLYVADDFVNYGQCRFECPRPVADTAQKQFVPSTVGTNFDDVDDVTFVITDYVDGTNVNDHDLYELGDLSTNPLVIHAVKPITCMAKTDAGNRQGATVLDSAGTQSTGAGLVLSNDPFIYEGPALLLNPNGSVAWTKATVDALKLGPKVAV